jgi:glycosyltransferase involved in cell wall biosynthesis
MSTSFVVVVGRDVAPTLPAVLDSVPDALGCVVVDDGSCDGTADKVPPAMDLVSHAEGLGYGAAQKTGYRFALEAGADRIVLLHGDGQYDTAAVLDLLNALDDADVALGSRFLCQDKGAVIPWWRRWGNRSLTSLANMRWGLGMSDLHTGARAFRAKALAALPLETFSDDYVFDQQVLVHLAANKARFTERAVPTRYDDAVQSITPWNSVRYGVGCLRTILAARH